MLDEVKNNRASLWISASAGTGKTKNLIDRILALLLKGAEPSRILCLTYTKAAAGEMLDRLSNYLNYLQRMTDCEVIQELQNIGFLDKGSEQFHEKYLVRVRELYNQSLGNDWVNIKTIHSFGLDLIKKFPLETGLYPGVKLCDDNQKQLMLKDAFNFVLKRPELHDDLKIIAQYTESILSLIEDNTIVKVRKFLSKYDDYESIRDFFVQEFETELDLVDLDQDTAFQKIRARILGEGYKEHFLSVANILSKGSVRDLEKASHLKKSVELDSEDFMFAVLTKSELAPTKSLCTKKIETEALKADLLDIQIKALQYLNEKRKLVSTKVNISFFTVLNEIILKFIENKFDQHLIDFDDVIINTLNLLENNLSWVFYRIDRNIEHILVDEAQDTSPEQWEIIRRLTSDFFSYEHSEKTIFVVGDEKQSIYSFQGANVDLFDKMHDKFKNDSLGCKQKFYDVGLNKSYRSEGNILKFVDKVFENDFEEVRHDTVKSPNKGVVEVVDLFPKVEDEAEDKNYLAEYIAEYIDKAIKNRVAVKDSSRSARPEDFLILFRRRNIKAMNQICDQLKKKNIPVSGVDRVLLKDEIIVADLIALAEMKTFPLNDLICACVLKSPIVGMSESDLMHLCLERGDKHLWSYILEREDVCDKYPIKDLQRHLQLDLSVSDFFHYVLVNGLREKFLNRLGDKCLTALEEFLEVCENYQKQYSPNISNFLRWFETNDQTIKKDFIGEGNEVRVMTVHASKGLQAPFVILADAHFEPKPSNSIVTTDADEIFWNFDKKMATSKICDIIEQNEKYRAAESQRLLYVALTRAESYLCILGEIGSKNLGENCWYNKIVACTEGFVKEEISEIGEENKLRRVRLGKYDIFEPEEIRLVQEGNEIEDLPRWYYEKLPESNQIKQKEKEKTPQTEFGDCVHLLLSKIDVHKRPEVLFKFTNTFKLSEEDRERAVNEALRVYNKFPMLFDKGSRSEVTLFCNGKEFRIDKIAEIDGEIWIIDFKTGVPQVDIPIEYKNQLQNYRNIYRKISNTDARTALLWTQNLELVEES